MLLYIVSALVSASPGAASAQVSSSNRWLVAGSAIADFRIVVDTIEAHSGRASLLVSADAVPTGFAGVATVLPAAPYAGQRLQISAFIRTAALGGAGAAVWARADSAGKSIAFVTTMGRRYFGGTLEWTRVSVDLDVPKGAASIALGGISTGSGQLWIDDVHLEALSEDPNRPPTLRLLGFEPPDVLISSANAGIGARQLSNSPHEAPRPLSARGLDNLVAFARLVGYVRFWYPSDSALATNWDDFTVRGVRVVEEAPTADSLVRTLRTLFAGVAPTVAIYRTGTRDSLPPSPTGVHRDQTVVFWAHCGYGGPASAGATTSTSYRSTRRRVAAPGGHAPMEIVVTDCGTPRTMPVPDPSRPFVADLGGAVSVSVPLALFTTKETTDSSWHPPVPTEGFALDDRATRLADVALLWMVPQHFYPYFDVVHTDWSAALRHALLGAARDRDAVALDSTLQRLIAALDDGHGNVLRTGLVQVAPDVLFGWVENRIIVLAVGDSARAAGIRVGEELLAVDGRPSVDVLRDAESRTSGATPQWIRHRALPKLALGMPGTVAVLRVRDPLVSGAPPRDVRLTRTGQLPTELRPAKIAEVRPGILYVDLGRVTDADVAAALPRLEGARGIVFDMRGYPSKVNTPALLSHLADSTMHSARFELPLVLRPDHTDMSFVDVGWSIAPQQPRFHAKVAFLTGSGAISYAESTMGLVEENHLAPIVGETTAGTNGDVDPFQLPGGYQVYWTGLRVEKRNGTPHHGVGIKPTVPVTRTLRGVRDGTDEVLARALEIVSQR